MAIITLLNVGDKNCPIFNDYVRRIRYPLKIITLRDKDNMMPFLPKLFYLIILDVLGQNVTSEIFAEKINIWLQKPAEIVFVVGGAYGVNSGLKNKADFLMAFGTMTWPHKLARIMLIEQIYRAQQILNRHPYHK